MIEDTNIVESPGAYYPQDFYLKTLNFLTASGQRIELRQLLVELSYYEDIYSFVASGYITILDSQGFIELLQLTGNEFIEVNFGKVKNGSNENDQKFRVYKSSSRQPAGNMNTETYTLYFCSEELLLSEQVKISKSYKGTKISEIVNNILKEELKIDNEKLSQSVIEQTTGVYDFLVPRMKPFEAISWLSTYARPQLSGAIGADMLFFETKLGFNFRSIQSMMSNDVYATYKYQAKNLDENTQSFQEKSITVIDYELGKPYDILNEIGSGTLANQLISIDPLTRTYKKTNFDYSKYRTQAKSLNAGGPTNSLRNRLGKTEQESYESVIKVATGNAGQKQVPYIKTAEAGVAQDIFVETYIPNRTAQINLANYTVLKASIPGDPGITAGRTVNFNLLTLKPSNTKKDLDKFYSGKYLVTAVRHIIKPAGVYQTILELAKDSSPSTYSQINSDDPVWKEAVKD
jgi:hypothetical protein